MSSIPGFIDRGQKSEASSITFDLSLTLPPYISFKTETEIKIALA